MKKLQLLLYFFKKDIKSKYAGSGLGLLWAVLLPLLQIVIFWLVFSAILRARPYANTEMPYIHFLLSAFFFWLAFSEGLMRSSHSILENGETVKKLSFPNIILPLSLTLSSYFQHLIGFLFFILVYAVTESPGIVSLLTIPILFFQLLFSLGLGMLFSSLVPYIRDLSHILTYTIQGVFFLSPIIYSIESVPEKLKIILYLNPFTYFASSYHKTILLNEVPPLFHLAIIILVSITAFFSGYYCFKKLKDGFADVL